MYEFAVTPAVTQLRRPGVTIDSVEELSIAQEVGLETGDRIVSVNGKRVRDYLDFRFQTSGEIFLNLLVKKLNGETWELDVERDEGEDLGINFEQIVPRQCANECLFCFCKGNPDDARPSLFVRDEDIRLSFLYGNYTTLSSVTEDEMNRIIEQRLSPQYVSVHATDLETRAKLLGVSQDRADISEKLQTLLENNIELHGQIVLCPGINDGAQLEKTLRDLAAEFPGFVSVAIVPVALTRYNTDARLTRVTPEFCKDTIMQVTALQKEFRKNLGTTFAFLGDEIYLKAGVEIPSVKHYGNYPQIEDGVGMIRNFLSDFEELLIALKKSVSNGKYARLQPKIDRRTHAAALKPFESNCNKELPQNLNGTIFTGEMFAPILRDRIEFYNNLIGAELNVKAVRNEYFGGDVSVAGLLSGSDFVREKNSVNGDFVIIPAHVIKTDEPVLIDGMSFAELKDAFSVPVFDLDAERLFSFLFQRARA
ncbi:MAG: DUF512 domain-containing protein [Pyrinomonadaceae bacterium]